MKIDIDRIKVDETSRIRRDIGDLTELQKSIDEVGLINPILIDEHNRLIAGYRRYSACKNLGWKEIDANIVDLEDDELKMLEAEAAENMFRKDFTPEEILAIQKRREEILEARRPKGWFERFWLWLKSLFAPKPGQEEKPAPPAKAPDEPVSPAAPVAEDKSAPEAAGEEDAEGEPVEKEDEKAAEPEPEPKPEPKPAPAEPAKAYTPKQPSSAEIVEKNGVRHIKWR